jgi:two-component system, OmpR family, response regulator
MRDYPDILAIDDDHAFVTDLKSFFRIHGIGVATISDPILSSALDFGKFKIVLLDLDMPGRSGQEVLAEIPAGRKPVMIIVSGHSDLETRLQLLDKGADFFMPKPVDMTELLLICRGILGRRVIEAERQNYWSVSRSKHTLSAPNGTVFGLTTSEFRILELLFEASPNVVAKNMLATAVTAREGPSAAAFYRSLEVMVSRMRTRFSGPDLPLPIKALRNVGYVFHGQGLIED